MRFSQVYGVRIPKDNTKKSVKKIRYNGVRLWSGIVARYVSLGDSIAAGHTIDSNWERDYGTGSQYGKNGNNQTVIVPGSYTDLIRSDLTVKLGGTVNATSFAKSGDTVADLMQKLDHDRVRNAIAKADYVTICIGANDVLQPAMLYLMDYINGDISQMLAVIQSNLDRLNNDNDANSYRKLLDKLYAINPDAQYVFTTIYNPYKYLYLEKSTAANNYKDGFLGPLVWAIPDFLGDTVANAIRAAFLKTSAVENLFNKINEMPLWAEAFVTSLNNVIKSKVADFGKPNFVVADTKPVFETVPDRMVSSPKHYNDLVNVEFTRGFDVEDMDWGQFWANVNWNTVADNVEQTAQNIITTIVEKVIVPDVDPHPETYGHHALKCSFEDALGWSALPRHTITYIANGANGAMASQIAPILDNMASYAYIQANAFTHPPEGMRFNGWNTSADGTGTSYSAGQFVNLTGDITLYAQWSNMYVMNIHHSYDSVNPLHGSGDTGPMECYALWIDGVEQPDLGAFSNGSRVISLPYGSQIGVVVQTEMGDGRSYITLNGVKIQGNSADARYTFTVTSHMDIHFEWNYWLDGVMPQSYWNCYVVTY